MAATTPVGVYPNGQTGFRVDELITLFKDDYSGAGTQHSSRWRVGTTSGMTVILWDSGLRENDDHEQGDNWCEFQPAACEASTSTTPGLLPGVTYYWDVEVRNTGYEISSKSTARAFTMESAPSVGPTLSAANWQRAQ